MLIAHRRGWIAARYEIARDGVPVAVWRWSGFDRSGELAVGGRTVTATASGWTGRRFRFTEPDGRMVAEGVDVGRSGWDLHTPDGAHRFERRSLWFRDQSLMADGVEVGRVIRLGPFSRDVQADLPTLPPLLQLCVTAALATLWERDDS